MKLCPNCAHYRFSGAPELFERGEPGGIDGGEPAGVVAARLEWIAYLAQDAAFEEQARRGGDELLRPPTTLAWCAWATPQGASLKRQQRLLEQGDREGLRAQRRGDREPLELRHGALQGRWAFNVNAAEGRIEPIYVLCERENPHGRCAAFLSKAPAGTEVGACGSE